MTLSAPRSGGGRAREPDINYRGLWQNYSQWVGEAGERYQRDVERFERMPGLGEEARARALGERETAYQDELAGLRRGSTYRQLQTRYAEKDRGGTLEQYYGRKYGEYQPNTDTAMPAETEAGRDRGPGEGAASPNIAGLGPRRPWWAL